MQQRKCAYHELVICLVLRNDVPSLQLYRNTIQQAYVLFIYVPIYREIPQENIKHYINWHYLSLNFAEVLCVDKSEFPNLGSTWWFRFHAAMLGTRSLMTVFQQADTSLYKEWRKGCVKQFRCLKGQLLYWGTKVWKLHWMFYFFNFSTYNIKRKATWVRSIQVTALATTWSSS